jgi:hypothetical protein
MSADPIAIRPRTLIVSASDSRFLPLLKGMIASIEPVLADPNVDLACFDIGLTHADRIWLEQHASVIKEPGSHFGIPAEAHRPALRSFLARPFLREYFPGYDVYLWVDSDVWLQDPGVIGQYVAGALQSGMAITHESERGYRFQLWLLGWTAKHFALGYGPLTGAYLLTRPHLNAGFFAVAAGAPQWGAWARCYEAAIQRTNALVPHDQFALNHALHAWPKQGTARMRTAILDPGCNWICDRGVPMWNDEAGAFCKPYAPYETIGAMHLAGPAKGKSYAIKRTGGGVFTTFVLHGASPEHPVLTAPQAAPDQLPPEPAIQHAAA